MKAASIQEIKQELQTLPPSQLTELCLRLARFKKDNKELLTYLLFEAADEQGYIRSIKEEIDREFEGLPKPNLYLTKKSLRKVLRTTAKQIRYTGSPQTQVEVLTYFLRKIRQSGIPYRDSPVLVNLYKQQLKKIRTVIDSLHEDLQHDYLKALQGLEG
ncbi:MAG TPA: hypothetical protein VGS79_12555 [Puia sp.]|nr:hypothetical protein [Puia sp.]